MGKVAAIKIEAGKKPETVFIDDDLLKLGDAVNIDKDGKAWSSWVAPDILRVSEEIRIISSPDGEIRNLPVVRKIISKSRPWINFYGVVYVVKSKKDDMFNLVSFSDDELFMFGECTFYNKLITEESLYSALFPDDDDYKSEEPKKKDQGLRGRITITCDDW